MTARQRLFNKITLDLDPGRVEWIGLRSAHRGEVEVVEQVSAIAELGLDGDHRSKKTPGSARQVSLISQEHIGVLEKILGIQTIDPALLRRNIVVAGININALRHQKFRIGDALFEATAFCHPCSRMDEALGKGGHAAMLGHGGLCAKVLRSGDIRVGDTVIKIDQ